MKSQKEILLIDRVRGGDRDAFSEIYHNFYYELCLFVERFVRDAPICENLIQDLFLNIWMQKENWNPKGTIRSYLYKGARNRAIDYLRQQNFEKNYLDQLSLENIIDWEVLKSRSYDQESHHSDLVDTKLLAEVQKSVAKLPDRMKLIFTLSRDEGLSYQEIADVMDISIKTVETQMGRALKSLREMLSVHTREDTKM